MADRTPSGLDLERAIAARLGVDDASDTHLQALAVLIDANLTDADRAEAFGAVMLALLGLLSADQLYRFRQIAQDDGEAAAMSYLGSVTRPAWEADRK